jgi:hypothetical protein
MPQGVAEHRHDAADLPSELLSQEHEGEIEVLEELESEVEVQEELEPEVEVHHESEQDMVLEVPLRLISDF